MGRREENPHMTVTLSTTAIDRIEPSPGSAFRATLESDGRCRCKPVLRCLNIFFFILPMSSNQK